jgi:hypothetical protein
MDKNRYTVAVALLLLFLFIWSAGTMHWRYAIALALLGAILFLADIAYFYLGKKLPDADKVIACRDAIWKRTVGPEFSQFQRRRVLGIWKTVDNSEEARWLLDHIDVMLDRQLTKACGLIAFNALVMAVMAVEMSRLPAPIQWDDSLSDILRFGMLGVICGLAVSSLICLWMLRVYWASSEEYGKFWGEFAFNIKTLEKRTHKIALGVFVSGVSLVLAVAIIVMTELALRPMPGA